MFKLAKAETILGRSDDVDLRLNDDGVSRHHAAVRIEGDRAILTDLDSANGTFCNGARLSGPRVLGDGDKISMGGATILKFTYQDALDEQLARQLYESAVYDGLTGLYNRRAFDERLRAELAFANRHGKPLALVIADVDHFKRINDQHGHPFGDQVLREIARRLAATTRAEDVLARFGGEEFIILCRETDEQRRDSTRRSHAVCRRGRAAARGRAPDPGDDQPRPRAVLRRRRGRRSGPDQSGGRRPLRGEAARPRPWRSIRPRITDARAEEGDVMPRPRKLGTAALSGRLALASLGTAIAIGVVCAVGLSSLENTAAVARVAVTQQLALIDDAAAMSAFQYQKGFVAEYLLSGNRAWLAELETSKPAFESWLAAAHGKVANPVAGKLLDEIQNEYAAYDRARKDAIALYDSGRHDEARDALETNHARSQRLRDLFHEFGRMARQDAERALAETERSVGRLAHVLVGTSIAGAIASLVVGFLWARRITRPIYELEVQVQSLTERTRIQVAPGRAGLEALGDQVTALVEKLEESDAALAEHRRRLMQSEKLSAVGELAAKLAHEVLNPLAGMKAAVQLLARQGTAGAAGGDVIETAEALNREVTRVEGLVRRLVNFSRPLAPRVEVAAVGALLDTAIDAARPVLKRYAVSVERREDENLEPVEVDPLLFTQVLVNLLVNAAEAMAPSGGSVEVTTKRAHVLGRDEISIRVADHGPGIRDEHLPQLFKPFFTTKPEGHGLGLAVSQNIVVEHGGRIVAENRPAREGSGAAFEVQLPVVR